MTLEPVGAELKAGTIARHRLQLMFEEAASRVAAELGWARRSATSDRYAMYVTMKDHDGREVAGLAYSDLQGDSAVWLNREGFGASEVSSTLKGAMPDFVSAGGDRFWGCPYVPLVSLDADFFQLRAEEQLGRIEGRVREVLAAVLVVEKAI
ncbi:MAG: hypothetical protein GTN78_03620 [Gemmatimonadales bacterium]|nr:hypothetical protein [Gemmatimonadales bacterium]NIQ99274.1 hypothetical protein [Gemmatimonadales bacterium]